MAELTSAQAKELARQFLGLAQSISNYRMENWDKQTNTERKTLSELCDKINSYVDDLVSLSTINILDGAEDDLKRLQAVTADIEKSIHKVEMVQKVINVAAAAMTAGAAIVAKNPKAIGKEVNALFKAWQEDLPSEKKKKKDEEERRS